MTAEERRHESAYRLGALMDRYGLRKQYEDLWQAGLVRPETLLFTTFGLPHLIHTQCEPRATSRRLLALAARRPPARKWVHNSHTRAAVMKIYSRLEAVLLIESLSVPPRGVWIRSDRL